MKVLNSIDKWIVIIIRILLFILIAAIMIIINIQIFSRKIFTFSLGALSDAPPYLMVFAIWIGAVLAARNRDHIKIEILDLIIKNVTVLNVIRAIIEFLAAICMGIFTYQSLLYVIDTFAHGGKDPSFHISFGYFYMIMPITAFFITIYFVVGAIKVLQRKEVLKS